MAVVASAGVIIFLALSVWQFIMVALILILTTLKVFTFVNLATFLFLAAVTTCLENLLVEHG